MDFKYQFDLKDYYQIKHLIPNQDIKIINLYMIIQIKVLLYLILVKNIEIVLP